MKMPWSPPDVPPRVGLAAVQHMMARAVMHPLGPRQRMRREHAAVASALIRPNDRLSSFSRLQIYNQQYWWRLRGAFMDDFPGLRAILGARRFDRVSDAYLASLGSTSWNLRDLGQHLELFLREHPEFAAPHGALALDMARVEWARVVAFDGSEGPRLDPQSLASGHPARLRIGLQPFLTLLEISHPIDRILGRLRQGKARFRPVPPTGRRIYVAVHRQEFSVYYKRLEAGEFHLLSSLRDGSPLATACAEATKKSGEISSRIGEKIQQWFANWMRLGWLCEWAPRLRVIGC
jgi:hypothetical protein